MSEVIQLRKRGVFTLPKSLRDKYELGEGDALHLVDVDGVFVLTPMMPMVPKLAREIQRLRKRKGVSTDELVKQLQSTREDLTRERYGDEPDAGSGASSQGEGQADA
jgi:bifunctional DNA-binding transcriptional regulator/antitoxin component of YhaV-PrlF toxin-antitoxin module